MSGKGGGDLGEPRIIPGLGEDKNGRSPFPPLHPPSFQIREGGGKRGVVDMTAKAAGPSFLSPLF